MHKITTKEDLAKNQEKSLKKQMEAYIEVAKHKLGRTPNLEDLMSLMSDDGDQAQKSEEIALPMEHHNQSVQHPNNIDVHEEALGKTSPAIANMIIYYGYSNKNGEKILDPNKVLFYEDPDTGSCYDCQTHSWGDRNPLLDHLQSRKLLNNEHDIVQAIAHGVVSDDDYESLNSVGLITDLHKAMWEKTKILQKQLDELQQEEFSALDVDDLSKSLEEEIEPEHIGDVQDLPSDIETDDFEQPIGPLNVVVEEEPGIIDQIIALASAEAENHVIRNIEPLIRKLAQEEILKYVNSEPELDEEPMEGC